MTELLNICYNKLTKKTIKLIDECYSRTSFELLTQETFNDIYKQLVHFFQHKKFRDEYVYNILIRLDNIKHIPEKYVVDLPLLDYPFDFEQETDIASYLYKYNIRRDDLIQKSINNRGYFNPHICDYVIRYIDKQTYPNIVTDNFSFNSNEFTFCTLLNCCYCNEEIKRLYDRFDKPRSYIIQKYSEMCSSYRSYYKYNKVVDTINFIDNTIYDDIMKNIK